MGYTGETIKGVSWVSLFRVITRIIALARTVILARIFAPDQFGLFGIAILVLALAEILTDTGVNVFLVQSRDGIKKYLDTAWVVSIIRGIFIGTLILLTSWFTVGFFNSNLALGLVMLVSIIPIIRGFINPAIAIFQKELEFNKEFYFKSSVFLADSVASVAFAILTRNIYSLLVGLLFSAVFEVILSFIYAKPRPKLRLNRGYLGTILHKGKWITAAGIFNYLFHNFDSIIVGRVLGTYSLGAYQMAYKISVSPLIELSDIISRVTFPVYVRIASDKKRIRKAFLKSILLISVVAVPLGIIAFGFADYIVNILLGPNWKGIIPVFKILIVFGVLRTISGYASSLFLGFNKQKYVSVVTFISLLGLAIFIYPLVLRMGMVGAAHSALIGSMLAIPFFLFFVVRLLFSKK
jgi:lipopolysaccharide exporter